MRRGVCLLTVGVLTAGLAASSAHADGTTTTTTGTTTTGSTTTAPAYARLSPSYLPAACVGAGAAAIAEPGRPVLTVGTPASNLGPSAYPANAKVVAFDSSAASGSTCNTTTVTLQSVSLLGGVVTAASVEATHAKGTVAGLTVEGTATTLAGGEMLAIGNWGQLTLGKRFGRLAAPLVLALLAPRDGLPAGTVIAVAFTAAPMPKTGEKHQLAPRASINQETAGESRRNAKGANTKKKDGRQQPSKPPPDYPASPSPFQLGGGLAPAAQHDPVVATAMQYLGVPYRWGGTSPTTGFDCSGLVQYVFAQLGVSLVHYAAAQYRSPDGVWVPPDRLQPGDLVFFTGSDGTRKEPGHVGIYAGDGYLIDAPHTGSFVRIDSLNERSLASQYVGARRIVSQLLAPRHLLDVDLAKSGLSAPTNPLDFASPVAIAPLGKSLGIAAAGMATVQSGSRGYWIWAGVVLGALLLLFFAGACIVRRRRPPDVNPSTPASN